MAEKKEVETKEVEVVETPKVEILRGRMPVAVVALIRFAETEATTSAVAAKYRTTVGKVDDIRKNRNFSYVDASFAPTADQKAEAVKYIEQLEGGDVQSALSLLDGLGVAEDGGEAFEAKRSSMRKSKKAQAPEAQAPEAQVDEVEDADLDELVD
jgi:hypothetical protein